MYLTTKNAVIMWKHLYCVVYFMYIFFFIFQLFLKPTKGHSGQADLLIGYYELYTSYVMQVELHSYKYISQLCYRLLWLRNSVELKRMMNKRNTTGVTSEARTFCFFFFFCPFSFVLSVRCTVSDNPLEQVDKSYNNSINPA